MYTGTYSGSDPINDTQSAGIEIYQGGSGIVLSDNTIDGNDNGIYSQAPGIQITDNILGSSTANTYEGIFLDQGDATLTGNTITGGNIGLAIISFSGNSINSAGTLDSGNSISGASVADVRLLAQAGTGYNPTLSVQAGNTISGSAIGIDVEAGSATISGGTITDNGTGIEFNNGGSGSVAGVNFDGTPNTTDLWITATAGTVTIGSANDFTGSQYYIINQSSQNYNLTSNGTEFQGATVSVSTPLSTLYGIQDEIVNAIDNASYGYVQIVAGNWYVTPSDESAPYGSAGAIQRAVNVASTNDTVNVQSGSYTDDVTINKTLTLLGAQAGVNAAGRSGSESVVNANSNGNTIFTIATNDVTINGFTVQGQTNPYVSARASTWSQAPLAPRSSTTSSRTIWLACSSATAVRPTRPSLKETSSRTTTNPARATITRSTPISIPPAKV